MVEVGHVIIQERGAVFVVVEVIIKVLAVAVGCEGLEAAVLVGGSMIIRRTKISDGER